MGRPGLSARAIADLVGGRVLGDEAVILDSIGPLDRAGPGSLSFLVSSKYLPYFRASQAGAVLVTAGFAEEPAGPRTRIVVGEPYRALQQAITVLYPESPAAAGIDPTARLGTGAVVSPSALVGPHAVLGDRVRVGARTRLGAGVVLEEGVVIGDDCLLGPHVVCGAGSEIGHRVVIKAGAVIGGSGFGYAPGPDGHQRIPHIGRCVLEDEVEIGSLCCVDRGSIDDTVIGRGTKIDNLVHIAHNVRIGERCLVMATSGIAGSVRMGRDVVVGGGVGIADHVEIGDRVRIAARSGVVGSWPDEATIGGYPSRNHRQWLRGQAALYRLAKIVEQLEALVEERSLRGTTND